MQTALIVGASGTLGQTIARELIARQYQVGLHYCTHAEPCETLMAQSPSQVKTYQSNFNDPSAIQNLVTSFVKDHTRIDTLVWAAGIMLDAPLLIQKEESLRATLDLNLKAPFLLLKAASRQFLRQKNGSIILLSSYGALSGRAGGSAYCMAHSGLLALMKSLAREWGPSGIRINSVLPAFIPESGMGRHATPEFAEAAQKRRVLKNSAESAGYRAAALAQLAADTLENTSISGQVLGADSRVV